MKIFFDTRKLSLLLLNYFYNSNPQTYLLSSEELKEHIGKEIDEYEKEFPFTTILIKDRKKYVETYESIVEAEERYNKSIANLFEFLLPKIKKDTILIVPSHGLMHAETGVLRPYLASLIAANHSIVYPEGVYPNGDGTTLFVANIGLTERMAQIDADSSKNRAQVFGLMCILVAKPLNAANQEKFIEFDYKVNLGSLVLAIFSTLLMSTLLYKLLSRIQDRPKPKGKINKKHMTMRELVEKAQANAQLARAENEKIIAKRNRNKELRRQKYESYSNNDNSTFSANTYPPREAINEDMSSLSLEEPAVPLLFVHNSQNIDFRKKKQREDDKNNIGDLIKQEHGVGGSAAKRISPLKKAQRHPRIDKVQHHESKIQEQITKIIGLLPNLSLEELSALEDFMRRKPDAALLKYKPEKMLHLLQKLGCDEFHKTRDKNQHHRVQLPDGISISSLIQKGSGTHHDHSAPIHTKFFDDLRKSLYEIGVDAELLHDIFRQKAEQQKGQLLQLNPY